MPGWNRKIYEGPLQQEAYRMAQLLEKIAASAAHPNPTTTTTTTTTTTSTTTTTTTTV